MRNTILRLWVIFTIVCTFLAANNLRGQALKPNPQAPVLSPSLPAGMQRGTTLEITLTGKNLTEPTGLLATFPCKVSIPKNKNNGKDASIVRVQLQVPANVPLGWYAIRLATKQGMSNLQLFCIDDLPQAVDNGKNHDRKTPQTVPVPGVVAGQVDNLKSDYFKIHVKAGQRLTFDVMGRRLGTPLDPQLSIWSVKTGRSVAYLANSPGLQSDVRLTHTFKDEGDYLIEIKDVQNRGGSDYVYRIRIGDFPRAITPIPLAAKRGSKVTVRFAGQHARDIPPVEVAVPDDPAKDIMWVTPPGQPHGWPVSLLLTDLPELIEHKPKSGNEVNRVPVPGAITGQFQKYAEKDRFRFAGKKGQKLTLQVHTVTLHSPALVYIVVRDAKGKELVKSNPAAKTPADQIITFSPPADGDYLVEVQHLNFKHGPDQVYRLSIMPPRQDFQLSLALDRWDIARGEVRLLPIQVNRKGYTGPIDVQVESSHPGITGKLTISANAKTGDLLLHAGKDVPIGPYPIKLRGTANMNGKSVRRYVSAGAAISDSLSGLPFPPRNLDTQLALAVVPEPPFHLQVALKSAEILPGGKAKVTVTVQREKGFDGAITLLPPEGFPGKLKFPKIKPIAKSQTSFDLNLPVDGKAPLGKHLVLFKGKAKVKKTDETAYAAPVTITVTRPFALKVDPAVVQLKQGAKTKIKITAMRKAGYDGPIKLAVRNLPANVKAASATIAKGKNTAEIEITAANNAAVGERKDANILGTATAARNQQQASPSITVRIVKK